MTDELFRCCQGTRFKWLAACVFVVYVSGDGLLCVRAWGSSKKAITYSYIRWYGRINRRFLKCGVVETEYLGGGGETYIAAGGIFFTALQGVCSFFLFELWSTADSGGECAIDE